ncbi:GAG-pre-integrase domain [Dillenia turbinata]|uniref:GAG-pre-integrase domain n=1 Tax=Dillenia turbinata TaxID=194707 RepID=A0AAN8ZND0_9MAGN
MTISYSTSNGKLTLGMLKNSMFNEEAKKKDMESKSSQALIIENRGRTKNKDQYSRGRNMFKKRSKTNKSVRCFYYKKTGHIKRNCRLLKEKKDEKGKNTSDDSNARVVGPDKEIESLVCTPDNCNHVGGSLSEWIVDTVAKEKLCSCIYKTWFRICTRQVNAVKNDVSQNLWHKRLEHMNEKRLHLLAKQSLRPKGLPCRLQRLSIL